MLCRDGALLTSSFPLTKPTWIPYAFIRSYKIPRKKKFSHLFRMLSKEDVNDEVEGYMIRGVPMWIVFVT